MGNKTKQTHFMALVKGSEENVLFSSPVTVIKYPDKNNLEDKGFVLVYPWVVHPTMAGKV